MNEKFWAARRNRGLSQQQLAQLSQIDQSDISRIERGWLPPVALQQRLAEALGVGIEHIFAAQQEIAS